MRFSTHKEQGNDDRPITVHTSGPYVISRNHRVAPKGNFIRWDYEVCVEWFDSDRYPGRCAGWKLIGTSKTLKGAKAFAAAHWAADGGRGDVHGTPVGVS